nr:MAG TPA: Plasmid maintenance system antidote protein [Caudoviricetes sp.]
MKAINLKNLTPKEATHPGEHLKDEIEARGIKQNDLALELDLPESTINEIIKGEKPINQDIATRLEKFLGIPAKFWMNAQSNYEIDLKMINMKTIKLIALVLFLCSCKAKDPYKQFKKEIKTKQEYNTLNNNRIANEHSRNASYRFS